MLKVVIADDEKWICQLIGKLIDCERLGIELVGVVEDGLAAFDLICLTKPDVVITDIRMPKMDGLELIRQVRQINLDTKFIVISGYRHFEYAHNAIKYGVEDYLLKPIKQTELNKALEKIGIEKRSEMEKKQEDIQIQKKLTKSRNIMHHELINKIIDNDEIGNLKQVNEEYSISLEEECFQAVAIKLDYKKIKEKELVQDNLATEKIIELISTESKPYVIDYIISLKESRLIVCVFNFAFENRTALNKVYRELIRVINDYLYVFNAYEITMGIGSSVDSFSQVHTSLYTALKALQYRIRFGTGGKIYYDDYKFGNTQRTKQIKNKLQSDIIICIDSFDSNKLKDLIINNIHALTKSRESDPSCYYGFAEELVQCFFKHIPFYDSEQMQYEKKDLLNYISNAYTVEGLTDALRNKLCELLDICRQQQMAQTIKPIREVKHYLDEHYAEKIVLEDVAKIAGLNPVYFSIIFKRETGNNFSNYLVNLRIEAAKALLRETNEIITVVAEKVGYRDAKYFSQLFMKKVGIKPSKYRKLYS